MADHRPADVVLDAYAALAEARRVVRQINELADRLEALVDEEREFPEHHRRRTDDGE